MDRLNDSAGVVLLNFTTGSFLYIKYFLALIFFFFFDFYKNISLFINIFKKINSVKLNFLYMFTKILQLQFLIKKKKKFWVLSIHSLNLVFAIISDSSPSSVEHIFLLNATRYLSTYRGCALWN